MTAPRAPVTLIVVDDRHAAWRLEGLLERVRMSGRRATILTADALLALKLRQQGHRAILTVDRLNADLVRQRDAAALEAVGVAYGGGAPSSAVDRDYARVDGVAYGPIFHYTLIPKVIRTIRNLHIVSELLAEEAPEEVLLVGGGDLVAACGLMARARSVATRRVQAGVSARLRIAWRRVRAGRDVRWVNSTFRALLLEPAFLLLLALRGAVRRSGRSAGHDAAPTQHPALIVTGDRFTIDLVQRVRDRFPTIVVAGATQPGRALFQDVGGVPLETFGRPADLLRAIRTAARSVTQTWRLLRDRSHHQRFATLGVNYWRLVRATVAAHLLVWPVVLGHVRQLVNRACDAHPDARLFVSHDVTAYNRILLSAADARRVPTVGVQHGILGEPNGHATAHVATLAVWGCASERWYRQQAPQAARFVVTGNPRFDALAGLRETKSRTPRSGGAPFTVVVCTGFVSEFSVCASELENFIMLQGVADWARRRHGARIVQKMHPGEEPAYYRHIASELGWIDRVEMLRDVPLYDLLIDADVLVASYSTTVLEAVALGTPAIVVDVIARRHHIPIDESPDVTIAFSIAELHATLDQLASPSGAPADEGKRRQFLHEYLYELDGGATERVSALLRTI